MSNNAATPKPGRIARLRSTVQNISTAAWAAIALGTFLVAAVAGVWLLFLFDPNHVPWRHALGVWRVATVVVLVLAIPPLTYWCLKLWLEGETSRFPDIDYAWKAGFDALRRHGIDLEAVPIFLILGSPGEDLERALIQAAGLSFRLRGEPEGPAPLHWYANPDGIYLFCSEAGWLSSLMARAEKRFRIRGRGSGPTSTGPAFRPTPATTLAPAKGPSQPVPRSGGMPADAPASAAASPAESSLGGTIMLDQFLTAGNAPVVESPARPLASSSGDRISGTMSLDRPMETDASLADAPAASQVEYLPPAALHDELPTLDPHDAAVSLQRLEYVGHLLRRVRRPLCPANGILALLPFSMIEGGLRESEELQKAVRSDLTALERGLQLRCPVTALVIGMEREPGFRELVRRVGRQRAASQRFGRRFDVRVLPTPEQMAALCIHVCGVFEDWIYALFREEGALTHPGNTQLYGLLCKVRCNLKGPLMEVLAGGFGHDPQLGMAKEPSAFSGCYFAAAGPTADRQAFVRGVFDKLLEEQEDVEWTEGALAVAARIRHFVWLATLGAAALTVVFLLMLVGAAGSW